MLETPALNAYLNQAPWCNDLSSHWEGGCVDAVGQRNGFAVELRRLNRVPIITIWTGSSIY